MIQDFQSNMVYLAHGLSHYVPVCRNLLEALHREKIHAEFRWTSFWTAAILSNAETRSS